ncbi:MAG: hypothetical protein ACKOD9_09900 [Rubrivivax sp.]
MLARLFEASPTPAEEKAHMPAWICVDQAEIPTSAVDGLPFVQALFGRPLENLPAPQAGVSAVISNFGLEYVPASARATCCATWLAPRGRLHLVMHARGSLVDRQAEVSLGDLTLTLEKLDFPSRVAALIKSKVSAPTDPMERMMHGVQVRDDFNHAVNQMKAPLEERGSRDGPLLEWLMLGRDIVQSATSATLDQALERLEELRAAYGAEAARLRAMRATALGPDDLQAFKQELLSSGFASAQLATLDTSAGQAAWVVQALKA